MYNYEIHVTVESCNIDHFKRYCGDANAKPLLIDLQRTGIIVDKHLMCSKRISTDDYGYVVYEALKISNFFISKNLNVLRIKIETEISNLIFLYHSNFYYECHVPVIVKDNFDMSFLQKISDWHLSKNIFKKIENCDIMFLTTRNVNYNQFEKSIEELKLKLESFKILINEDKIEKECVILDTNLSLDNKWVKNLS